MACLLCFFLLIIVSFCCCGCGCGCGCYVVDHNACFIQTLENFTAPGGLTQVNTNEPDIPLGPPGKRQRHRSARIIQKWMRGYLGRVTFAKIKSVHFCYFCRQKNVDFVMCFVILLSCYFMLGVLWMQDWRRQVAIINIQRVVRGFLGRRYFKEYRRQRNIDALRRRKEVLFKHKASKTVATVIKTHWERQSVRRKINLAKEAHDRGNV